MRKIFSRRELAFMCAPLALVLAFRLHPTALLESSAGVRLLEVFGGTGACSRERALVAFDQYYRFMETQPEYRKKVSVLETDGKLSRVSTPSGEYWIPSGAAMYFLIAEDDRNVYTNGEAKVRPNDVVLDCGANVGVFTKRALAAGARLIVAVEPSPANVAAMQRTFTKEIADGRVIVYPKGVWDKDDVLVMNLHENTVLDSFVMEKRTEDGFTDVHKVELPLTTIDKMVAELKLGKVDFIKMDIEGAERRALKGAAQTIRTWRPRMSVAVENLDDDQYVVPQTIRSIQADYKQGCGPCDIVSIYQMRPAALYFY